MTGQTWRKSSWSTFSSNCAEVATWRTATASGSMGDCAEVAASGTRVLVRDSQLADASPVLRFSPAGWAAFLAAVRQRQGSGQA